jgi:SAM-dependent methyltransferase
MEKMEHEPITSLQQLREAVYGFRRSRIILTAFELGLFSKLADQALGSAQLAKIIGTDARATDRLLSALCAIGLIKKSKGQFANTRIARDLLVAGKPRFMAGLAHSASQWQSWHTLSAAVRHGGTVCSRKAGPDPAEAKRLTGFIAAMHERATPQAPAIVRLLDLANVKCCLDIGGGSGAYAMALVRANTNIHAVVFDLPAVVPLAEEYIRHGGLADRVKTVAGDFEADPLGGAFDLAFLSAILHGNSAAQNRALLRKAAEALNPRGQLVVQDFIMAEDRTTPAFGALFALNMLVGTEAGDTYTESQVRGWMEEAGLAEIVRRDTAFGASLMIGRKAGC